MRRGCPAAGAERLRGVCAACRVARPQAAGDNVSVPKTPAGLPAGLLARSLASIALCVDCEDSAAGLCLIVMLRSLACSRRVAQAAPVNVRTQPGDALPSRRRLRAPCRVAPSSAECAATSAIEPADPVDCVVRRLRGSCVRGIRACRCSSSPAAPATPSSTCRPAPAVRPRLSGPARAPGLRPVCAVGAGRTRKAPL